MATHQRQKIREAVRDRLMGGTDAAERVYATRQVPYEGIEQLPAIAIYTTSETVDPDSRSTAPRRLTRNLQLAVEGAVALTADVDNAVDDLARAIERLMDADPTLGGTCIDSILASTSIGISAAGEMEIGDAILTYAVTYETAAPEAEDVPLENLTTVDTKTSLGGTVLPQDQAEDINTLPTT